MTTEGEATRKIRLRIFLILFSSFLALIAAAAVSVGYSVHRYWEDALRAEITRSLTQKAQMFAARVNTDHEYQVADIARQEGQVAGARATVIDTNGNVLADSEVQLSTLEGEGRRPEFMAALRGEISVVIRKRGAFGVPVLYAAVPVSGGAVRLAYPLADLDIATTHARRLLFIGSGIAAMAALAIAWVATSAVMGSLGR